MEKERLLFFDINRVVKRYLVQILNKEEDHPIKQLFFKRSIREKIQKAFKNPIVFLGSYKGKKSYKVDRLHWCEEGLISNRTGLHASTGDELVEGLLADRFCPSVFVVFLILKFLNGIRCLGSFSQLEYLEEFRQRWQELNLAWSLFMEPDYDRSLTTGRIEMDSREIWPLDLVLTGEVISTKDFADIQMEELWSPILKQLTDK